MRNSLYLLLLAWLAVLITACQPEEKSYPNPPMGISIDITGGICPNVVIQAGEQVTWTNSGKADHVVRHQPEAGASQFDSGVLGPGNTFAYVFPAPGTYAYACAEDGSMTGTVTVSP